MWEADYKRKINYDWSYLANLSNKAFFWNQ